MLTNGRTPLHPGPCLIDTDVSVSTDGGCDVRQSWVHIALQLLTELQGLGWAGLRVIQLSPHSSVVCSPNWSALQWPFWEPQPLL